MRKTDIQPTDQFICTFPTNNTPQRGRGYEHYSPLRACNGRFGAAVQVLGEFAKTRDAFVTDDLATVISCNDKSSTVLNSVPLIDVYHRRDEILREEIRNETHFLPAMKAVQSVLDGMGTTATIALHCNRFSFRWHRRRPCRLTVYPW
eukprot:RCo023955